jgi:hypothetical protein
MAYVNSTNRFYINNGTGWYSISLVNTNPNITSVQDASANTTPFTLATDGTATVITITANDPEQVPLTYNYSVTSGSLTNGGGTTATVTQSDNVFTVTPSTTEAYAGTFELTFTASDGINTATNANSFTLEFITIIANSRYTTLLATAVDTSDNNDITDASSNNHSITVSGDAHAGTFSPYSSGGYSTYFDGSSSYLTLPNTTASVGTNDFTLEAWAYTTDISTIGAIFKAYSSGTEIEIRQFYDDTYMSVNGTDGSRSVISGSNNITPNVWHHYAIVRDNGTVYGYLDGALVGSVSYANNISGSLSTRIGADQQGGSRFNGYITDLRLVNGTAITPPSGGPTERLEAVTNTSLLTCHLPYIVDGSTNDHSITVDGSVGNVSTKPFSPYDYLEYSATDHGGSVYFDGSGDYLDTNSAINFSSGGCIEGWVYITSVTDYAFFIASTQGAGSFEPRWYVGHTNAGDWRVAAGDAISNNLTSYDLIKNQWNHFVLSNDGSRSRLFANGVLIFTKSVTPLNENLTFTLSKYGPYAQYLMTGNLSDVRVTTSIPTEYQTSSTTVGSSIFTPPTAPLSSSGTELHIKGTDASIIDKSQSTNLKLVGNTTGSTTQVKFVGSKTMYFDGNGDYIITPQQELGTEDFTIEGWHYLLTRANSKNGIFGNYSSYNAGSLGMFAGHSSATTTSYQVAYDGDTFPANVIQGGTIAYNQWVHFAVVRNSGTMNLYINGTSVDSISATASLNGVGSNLIVGAPADQVAYGMHGYLEDFRITKGLARYTANFTPPTASLKG